MAEFLIARMQEILQEWDEYAQRMTPASDAMTVHELRDHAEQMVQTIAAQLDTPSPALEPAEDNAGGEGEGDESPDAITAAAKHGAMRQEHRFTLLQLSSEFRALRTSILRLWLPQMGNGPESIAATTRFNEAIDQALSESIVTYSGRTQAEHDLFIAILGHDLRGLLATMTMVGDLLGESSVTPDRATELGKALVSATKQMTSMVNDLLDLARSKLSSGIPIVLEPSDALQVCEASVADAAAMYPDCEFVLSAGQALPGSFDAVRLRQLVTNLLINAAQHGGRAHPVHLDADGDASRVTLRVTNTGDPIPVERLEAIFDPMRRLEDMVGNVAKAGSRTSLGLGLYICREIALGHGGHIAVTSNERDGTSFVVTLPREADEDESIEKHNTN